MDARSWSRVIVEKEVVCAAGKKHETVFLYDLSPGGCMIEFSDDPIPVGMQVRVGLGEFDMAAGEVVWQAARCAGVRFGVPVHEAIVRHLGFVPNALAFEDQLPRDRFGRTLPPLGAGDKRDLGAGGTA